MLIFQVYLAAIAGYLPSSMVQCIATFMDACYIACRNAITGPSLEHFWSHKIHTLWNTFIEAGIWMLISLPHQHALFHYFYSIHLFGSPNGLCLSITESKHIKAVKEPWRQSSRYHALIQMLWTLVWMDKMENLQHAFAKMGMLAGTTSSYITQMKAEDNKSSSGLEEDVDYDKESEYDEGGPASGTPSGAMSNVKLATKCGMYIDVQSAPLALLMFLQNLATPAVTFTNLQNISTNPSFLLLFAVFSLCATTRISSRLLKPKICLWLRVKSKFITLLSQYTMRQVIYAEQVVYIANTFTWLHLSTGMNAVIQFLWFLMNQKVGWRAWKSVEFYSSFPSSIVDKVFHVHWSTGLSMMKSLIACGPCSWSVTDGDSPLLKSLTSLLLLEVLIFYLFMGLHGFLMILATTTH